MIIKVSGMPALAISGSSFVASVPVITYDDCGWSGAQTTLNVTGLLSDSAQTFLTKLKSEADTWRASLSTQNTLQTKLAGLVGKTL